MHCPPVTTAVIRRPDSKYQLGFCVENGVVSACGDRSGARLGSAEGSPRPSGRGTRGSSCGCVEEHSAPALLVPARAAVSQGSAVPQQKALHSSAAALAVGSVSLVLLSCLLSGWWSLPGFLVATLGTFVAVPSAPATPCSTVAALEGQRSVSRTSGSWWGGWAVEGVARLRHTLTDAPNSIGDAVTPPARRSWRPRGKLWLCSPGSMGARGFHGWVGGAELPVSQGHKSLRAALALQLSTSLHWRQCKGTALPSLQRPWAGGGSTRAQSSCREPAWMRGFGVVAACGPGLRVKL